MAEAAAVVGLGSLIGGAALGAVFGETLSLLSDAVKHVIGKDALFKSTLEQLQSTLSSITPLMGEIEQFNRILERRKDETDKLINQMKEGENLVRKCLKIHRWKQSQYASKLVELNLSIQRFFQLELQAQTARDVRQTLVAVNGICNHLNLVAINGDSEPPAKETLVNDIREQLNLKMELFKVEATKEDLLGGAGIGARFEEALSLLSDAINKDVIIKAGLFKVFFERLQSTLSSITRLMVEREQFNRILYRRKEETNKLIQQIREGETLLRKFLKSSRFNYFAVIQYTNKLVEFHQSILSFFQIDLPARIVWDLKETNLVNMEIKEDMAEALLGGPAIGAGFGEALLLLSDAIKDMISEAGIFKLCLEHFQSTLSSVSPLMEEKEQFSIILYRQKEETNKLIQQMREGETHVRKCFKIRKFNYLAMITYASKLVELHQSILSFFQVYFTPQLISKEILVGVDDIREHLNLLEK